MYSYWTLLFFRVSLCSKYRYDRGSKIRNSFVFVLSFSSAIFFLFRSPPFASFFLSFVGYIFFSSFSTTRCSILSSFSTIATLSTANNRSQYLFIGLPLLALTLSFFAKLSEWPNTRHHWHVRAITVNTFRGSHMSYKKEDGNYSSWVLCTDFFFSFRDLEPYTHKCMLTWLGEAFRSTRHRKTKRRVVNSY